jgi:predicted nucleic-acid-binding protein
MLGLRKHSQFAQGGHGADQPMRAVDTHILVRLLTVDDKRQAEKVRSLFDQFAHEDGTFFISDVIIAELCWTLERT